ncbi:MAG TPA: hypothetical protein PK530_02745 [Anaerolineales bacterium]|nr:hypothetical protein [Anaerolineales bacterium]
MKALFTRFSFLFITAFFLFAVVACTEPTLTPTPSGLAVPKVPPIEDVDNAIAQWKNGNNTKYSVTVEETTHEGTSRYRIVIADGKVRAAQQQAKVDGAWQTPTAMDLVAAEQYTVNALLARVRNDVLGLGVVPMDMTVIFDPISGFPSVVDAKGLPTYNEAGNLQLNRDMGYTLTADVRVLIEDTVGKDKDPLLFVTRSGGEEAYCDTLRVYADGSSIYTDDCREVLLQLTPPEAALGQLQEWATSLGSLDETTEEAGVVYHLVLNGTGTETPGTDVLTQLWTTGRQLADMLSHPIGAGMTLLFTRHDQLYGYDMQNAMGQPSNLELVAPLYGMLSSANSATLAYADNEKLHWMDLQTGDTGVFFANPTDGHFLLRGWNNLGTLLLQRVEGEKITWGWTSKEDPVWHGINLADSAFACDSGVSLNPNANEFVVAAGGECATDSGLTLVNIADGSTRKLIDSQSVPGSGAYHPSWSPDGTWIAFSLTLMDTPENPQKIFLVRTDGSEMTAITTNTTGEASNPIWSTDGTKIYYALHNADSGADGLYVYSLSGGAELVLEGADFRPISTSPSDEFLVYYEGASIKTYLLTHGSVFSVAEGEATDGIVFVGWLDTRTIK